MKVGRRYSPQPRSPRRRLLSAQVMKRLPIALLSVAKLFTVIYLSGCGGSDSGNSAPEYEGTVIFGYAVPMWFGCAVLAAEFAFGYCYWAAWDEDFEKRKSEMSLYNFPLFAHAVLQFLLPLLAWITGYADCSHGLPWKIHWFYAALVVLAMPGITCRSHTTLRARYEAQKKGRELPEVKTLGEQAKIPILRCRGSFAARLYFYIVAVINATDLYLDTMTAVIASACGWRLAWCMFLVVFAGILLQACLNNCITNSLNQEAMWGTVLSQSPEAMNVSYGGLGESTGKGFMESQGITKLVTENLPQAYLAITFAREMKPNNFVWFSVTMSLLLALKGFITGMTYFCCPQTAEESDSENSDEEE